MSALPQTADHFQIPRYGRFGPRLGENSGRKSVGATIDSAIADPRISIACDGSYANKYCALGPRK